MTQEEKAKAYDNALKVLHKYDGANIMFTQDLKEEMFPELREEFEDERIREELLQIAKESKDSFYMVMTPDKRKRLIAWLEKQGELVNSLSKGLDNAHERIDELIQKNNLLIKQLEKQGKQKATDWNEGDEIMLDNAIVACNRCYFSKTANWLKSLKEKYTWKPSDEQITWLYRAADNANKDSRMKQVLNNLLSDLKKLREE